MIINSKLRAIYNYFNRKRPAEESNPAEAPLDTILTPKRFRKVNENETYKWYQSTPAYISTAWKSKDDKYKLPGENDVEELVIDDEDENEVIVEKIVRKNDRQSVSEAKGPSVSSKGSGSKNSEVVFLENVTAADPVIYLGGGQSLLKNKISEKPSLLTGAKAKISNKYSSTIKSKRQNYTRVSNGGDISGNFDVSVYNTLFKENKSQEENYSNYTNGTSQCSREERFNSTTGWDSIKRSDVNVYREYLNSYLSGTNSMMWSSCNSSATFSNNQQRSTATVDKLDKDGVFRRKIGGKVSWPLIDLTKSIENQEEYNGKSSELEVIGFYKPKEKSDACDRRCSVPLLKEVLKASVPSTQLSTETASNKCGLNRSPEVLKQKLYGSRYLKDNFFSQLKQGYSANDKVREQQILEQEADVKYMEEKRNATLQMKIDSIMDLRKIKYQLAVLEAEKLPELSPEMRKRIDDALKPTNSNEVLVDAHNLSIRRKDMETLKGLNWLNDEIMNFYFNLLMERGKLDNYPSVYSCNTFFYPKLMSGGHAVVKRWTKKVDLFAYDFILIPVHLGMHWCLAVVNFKTKKLQYYDSMGGKNTQCLEAVKKYLEAESLDKRKSKYDFSGWEFENVQDIPQQMNGSDCGMFACKYAEYVTRDAKITFEQEDMPYFRNRMVYEILTNQLL